MGSVAFHQKHRRQRRRRLQESIEHRRRGRGRGGRHGRSCRQQDTTPWVDIEPQDRRDQGAGDQVPAHQTGKSQVHAAKLVQTAQDLF